MSNFKVEMEVHEIMGDIYYIYSEKKVESQWINFWSIFNEGITLSWSRRMNVSTVRQNTEGFLLRSS